MSTENSAKKTLAPAIRATLTEAVGEQLANRIMVGSCSILTIDEDDLIGENFDNFVTRMEIVIPALIGTKPGEAVIKRLWELKT